MIAIRRVEQPASMKAPGMRLLEAEAGIWSDVLLAKVGSAELAETVPLLYSYGAQPQYSTVIRLGATGVPEPSLPADWLGVAAVTLPMRDNLELAELSWAVRADRQGEGIGTALFRAAVQVAREHHRSSVICFTWEGPLQPSGPSLAAGTGQGSIDATTREARFLVNRGFRLNQVEQISMLELPARDAATRLRDRVRARTTDAYECVTVFGATPHRLLEAGALLRARMSADLPTGDLDLTEVWDADRVRASDQSLALADREQLQTFVRHVPSGAFVGFTRLVKDRGVATIAHQWETLVVDGHRGHGLGMLCKATNHAASRQYWPTLERIDTGNAAENQHMLAINTALGYRPYAAAGFWELHEGAQQ